MSFKYKEAKDSGYSDEEIASYLQKQNPKFDFTGAKKAGYSDEEIAKHLSGIEEKPQRPLGVKEIGSDVLKHGGASALGSLTGAVPDIAQTIQSAGPFNPLAQISNLGQAFQNLTNVNKLKGSEEVTKEYREKFGIEEPKTPFQKAVSKAGQFAGPLSFLGPAAAASGAGFGVITSILEELGLNPDAAAIGAAVLQMSPQAFKNIGERISIKPSGKPSLPKSEIMSTEIRPSLPISPEASVQAAEKGGIAAGKIVPQAEGAFELQEQAAKALEKPPQAKPLGVEVKIEEIKPKTLEGRVTNAPELGKSISSDSFDTEAQAGREISNNVKELASSERKPIEEAYKKAKEITKSHNDIYPELAKKNDEVIKELEEVAQRNAGQEAVYKQAKALESLIGTSDALIEQNAARLIAQADSMAQLANYELPYVGYKGKIKSLVQDTNSAVIGSLEKAGLNAKAVKHADELYSKWANRFLGDEISQYLEKKILNPESLARQIFRDEGIYRAVKQALGERSSPLMNKIDRTVVENRFGKYFEKPEKIGTKEYQNDLKNLNELIGKNKTAEVDAFLRKRLEQYEKSAKRSHQIKEAGQIRETSMEAKKSKPTPIKERIENVPSRKPEQIAKSFNSRSDIRKIRSELRNRGQENLFEKLSEKKVEEIFREGGYGSKKLTGNDIVKIIEKDHEILEELLGKESLNDIYKEATIAANKEISEAQIKKLLSKLTKIGVSSAFGGGIATKVIKSFL